MGEVIHVDFRAQEIRTESNSEHYMRICADVLDEEDFEDFLRAINDPEFYKTCEEDLQDIVDGYWYQVNKC